MTLKEAFTGLSDPRTGPAQRHDLREMILMALCAVLCGADTWVDVAEWAEDNEIAAIKALLATLTLKGCIVTIDAIGCQTEIAQQIVERGGDYLLALKDNQGQLADALREFFAEADADAGGFGTLPVSRYETLEKDHGRIETRRVWWVSDLAWLDRPIRRHWPKLARVGMVERSREINGKTSTERAFYIGSKDLTNAEAFALAARSHWGVENRLHWCSMSRSARTTAGCAKAMRHRICRPCASSRCHCCARIPSTPSAACAVAAKPPTVSPITAPHCLASLYWGKCDCPDPRNRNEFLDWFPSKAACLIHLEKLRWLGGFVCPRCGSIADAYRATRTRLMCRVCKFQSTVTTKSIFDKMHTPLRVWLAAIWYVTNQRQGVSALGLQRVEELGSYQTVRFPSSVFAPLKADTPESRIVRDSSSVRPCVSAYAFALSSCRRKLSSLACSAVLNRT